MDANAVNSDPFSLRNIESKYKDLKGQVQTAIKNKNGRQLRLHLKTLKALMDDLGMVLTEHDTSLEKLKQHLYNDLKNLNRRSMRYLPLMLKSPGEQQQALQSLEDIEVQLAENHLDQLVKDKNPEFSRVKNNLRQCQHKLSLVDIVDNDVKDKCKILLEKSTNMMKELAKREFDYKLSQNLECYKRIITNFNPATNLKDIIIMLEALRKSVENLTEVDDVSLIKKRDLLNSINRQLVQTDAAIVLNTVKKDQLRHQIQSSPDLIAVYYHRENVGSDQNSSIHREDKFMAKLPEQYKGLLLQKVDKNKEDKFYKLKQDIKGLMEQLQGFEFIRGGNLHQRQTSLVNEMQIYVDALQKEAMDEDFVINIERQLDNLSSLLNTANYDIQLMAEELQVLQTKLQDHKFTTTNEVLLNKKTSVVLKADDLAYRIKQCENQKKDLDEIDDKLSSLSPQVNSFVGVKSENKYHELNESINRLRVQLERMDSASVKLLKRRLKLMKDLHGVGRILDERAQQTQDLEDMEREVEKMDERIKMGGDIVTVADNLDNLMKRFTGLNTNNELASRENDCIEKISLLAIMIQNQLDDMKKIDSVNKCYHINQFYDLKEDLYHLNIEINNLNIPKTSLEYTSSVRNLNEKIYKIGEYIHKKIPIHCYLGDRLNYQHINRIDEQLNQLQITVGKLQQQQVGFKEDVDACMMRIIMLIQQISEYNRSANTFV